MTNKGKEHRMLIYRMLADIEDENDLMQIFSFVHRCFVNPPKQRKKEAAEDQLKAQDEMIRQIYDNLDTLKPEYALDTPEAKRTLEDLFEYLEKLGVIKRNICEEVSEKVQRLILISLSAQEKQGFVRGFKLAAVLLGGVSWQKEQ